MEASSSVLHQVLPTCPKKQKQQLGHQPPPNPPPEKRLRPQPEQSLRCPRCDSTNTKFCYYNNYSLSQPRYFCKGCRRYWTHGGTLRNVPVGGGCRKNKARIATSITSNSTKRSSPGDQKSMLSTEVSSTSTNLFLPTLPTPASLPFTFSAGVKTPPSSDHDGNNGGSDYLMPTVSPYLLVDLLRDGSLENAYQSMLLQGGGGEEAPLLPFGEVGNGENGEAGKQEGCRGAEVEVGGLPQQLQVEGGERDLWSSAGPNWHGLLNSTI